ncbi:MAG: hypothetical protein J7562_13455 [Agrobacterium tumefaciens]|nr:hypothetical protein [Agrobacterium tumefaciens]
MVAICISFEDRAQNLAKFVKTDREKKLAQAEMAVSGLRQSCRKRHRTQCFCEPSEPDFHNHCFD